MFGRADRYLASHFLRTFVAVAVILSALFFFFQVLDKAEDLGKGGFDVYELSIYAFLAMPRYVYELVPLAVLLAALISLGQLASHSELMSLRLGGWSVWRIGRPLFFTALLIGAGQFFLGEWLAPVTTPMAEERRLHALGTGEDWLFAQGVWLRYENSLLHAGAVAKDGDRLERIWSVVMDERFRGVKTFLYADSAVFAQGQWRLGQYRQGEMTDEGIHLTSGQGLPLPLSLPPETLRSLAETPYAMTLKELGHALRAAEASSAAQGTYALAWWRRLSYPLVSLAMVTVALAFTVGGSRRGKLATRILLGLALGFAFHLLNQMGGFMSMGGAVPPAVAAFAPMTLFFLFSAWLIRKIS